MIEAETESASSSTKSDSQSSLVTAVMIAVFLAAVDQTIVSTALPSISTDLDNKALYAWVFTAYMVATTVFVPISGTIGDIYGRRPVLLFGIIVFAIGSLCAGCASSMPQLIGFRALQGIGAGVLTANAFALLGDVYSIAEMARVTGIMSAVYGLAGAIGPVLGGVLTDHIGWRWIFWCNVPACIAIGWVLFLRLPRSTVHKREPVDIAGAVTLTAALLPALAALSWAGEGISISEPRMLLAICCAIFFGYWFILNERRAVRPIVALHLFRHLTFTLAMLAMFGVAVAMYAALSYAPLLFQQRMGMSASQSGAVTAPLVLTLSVTAAVAGRMVGRGAGHRNISVLGMAIAAAALGWLSFLPHDAGKVEATLAMALFGAGLGFTMPTLMLAAQGAVPHGHIGITAALAKFFRSVGGLVGVVTAGAAIRYFQNTNPQATDAITSMIGCAALAMLATLLLTLLLPEKKSD